MSAGPTDDLQQEGPLGRVTPVRAAVLPRPSLVVRFLRKVRMEPGRGCWVWTGGTYSDSGYGWFRHPETNKAHRVAYLLLVGPIPEGLEIDHMCRNKLCVNPDHLEPVTPRVNIRRARGESWVTCDRLHPEAPTRLSTSKTAKGVRMRCLECHRVNNRKYALRQP